MLFVIILLIVTSGLRLLLQLDSLLSKRTLAFLTLVYLDVAVMPPLGH